MAQGMKVMEAMQKVKEGANLNVQDIRTLKACPVGKGYRQGDIYVYRVPNDHPRGKKLGTRKLAIGQGEGSNHFAEGEIELYEGIQAPSFCERGTFLGPVIVAPKGFRNTHPKHAHVHVEEGGVYQVTHQMDARTLERVRD